MRITVLCVALVCGLMYFGGPSPKPAKIAIKPTLNAMSSLRIHHITAHTHCLHVEGHANDMPGAIMVLKQFKFCAPITLQQRLNEVYFST